MKNYLITGGLGFIGGHLTQRLLREDCVIYIADDRSNASVHERDFDAPFRTILTGLSDAYNWEDDQRAPRIIIFDGDCAHHKLLTRIGSGMFDAVFHMAALPRVEFSIQNPVETTRINLMKSLEIAMACAQGNTRIIFSSTAAIYGNSPVPTKESSLCLATSPYGIAKSSVESFFRLFHDLYGLDWVSLRYFNVYGPGQKGDSPYCTAIAAWCHRIKEGKPLRSDGDGTQTRDMIFVDDVVNLNYESANLNKINHRIFNIGTGIAISNNSILEYFKIAFPNHMNEIGIEYAPERIGDVKHACADISRLQNTFDSFELTKISDGLEKTFKWWRIN